MKIDYVHILNSFYNRTTQYSTVHPLTVSLIHSIQVHTFFFYTNCGSKYYSNLHTAFVKSEARLVSEQFHHWRLSKKKKGFSVTAIWRENISIFRNVDLFELIMLNYNHDYSWLMINHDCTLWLIIDYSWLTWLKYLSIENHNYNKYIQKLD